MPQWESNNSNKLHLLSAYCMRVSVLSIYPVCIATIWSVPLILNRYEALIQCMAQKYPIILALCCCSIVHLKKWRSGEMEWLGQGHRARKWPNCDFTSRCLTLVPGPLTTSHSASSSRSLPKKNRSVNKPTCVLGWGGVQGWVYNWEIKCGWISWRIPRFMRNWRVGWISDLIILFKVSASW